MRLVIGAVAAVAALVSAAVAASATIRRHANDSQLLADPYRRTQRDDVHRRSGEEQAPEER